MANSSGPPWDARHLAAAWFAADTVFPRLALRLLHRLLSDARSAWADALAPTARAPADDAPPDMHAPFGPAEAEALVAALANKAPPGDAKAAAIAVAYGRAVSLVVDLETRRDALGLDDDAAFVWLGCRARACSPRSGGVRRLTPLDAALARRSNTGAALLEHLLDGDERPADALERLRLGDGWVPHARLVALSEASAKHAFTARKDPEACALLYVALGKHKVLGGLYKATRNAAVAAFLTTRDFAAEEHRKAAVSNALKLIGQQRFELAAAFLLLAHEHKDAFDVLARRAGRPALARVALALALGSSPGEGAWPFDAFGYDQAVLAPDSVRHLSYRDAEVDVGWLV